MAQAKTEHSISERLPAACKALTLQEYRTLYFTVQAASEAFIAGLNRPIAKGAVCEILSEYAETMDWLCDHIAEAVEAKPVSSSNEAFAKFDVLMDHQGRRSGQYAQAAQTAVRLLAQMAPGGRN